RGGGAPRGSRARSSRRPRDRQPALSPAPNRLLRAPRAARPASPRPSLRTAPAEERAPPAHPLPPGPPPPKRLLRAPRAARPASPRPDQKIAPAEERCESLPAPGGVEEAVEVARLPGDGEEVLAGDTAVQEVGALAGDELGVRRRPGRGRAAQGDVVDPPGLRFGLDLVAPVADGAHLQPFGAPGA